MAHPGPVTPKIATRCVPRLLGSETAPVLQFEGALTSAELTQYRQRREIYGRTEPRDGLGAFDALAMDILEGRV